MTYDVDYFIRKFEAIPERLWCMVKIHDEERSCAIGHCGGTELNYYTEQSMALADIFFLHFSKLYNTPNRDEIVWSVNDGSRYSGFDFSTLGSSPRTRILTALYEIKKLQQPKQIVVTKYVAVPVSITEQASELILS